MLTEKSFHPPVLAILLSLFLIAFTGLGCGEDIDPAGENQPTADGDVEPGDGDVEPGDLEPGDGEPGDLEPGDSEPGDLEPGDIEPGDLEPGDLEPGDIEPGDGELPDLEVSAILPDRGPVTGGTPFVIEGQGFTTQTTLLFDALQVEVDLIDGRLSGVTPPSDAVGPATIRVIDAETGEDSLIDGFNYLQPLLLTSAQPDILNVDGGVEISLFGNGFTADTRATVGGVPAQRHTLLSPTHLRIIVPPNPAGPADLRLTDRNDSFFAPGLLTYVAPIRLTQVSPPVGAAEGGTIVTLSGSGFDDDLRAFFGALEAEVLSVNAAGTEATVRTPSSTPGLVHVNIEVGDDGAILTDAFAFLGASGESPSLEGVFPARGSTSGGDEVHLFGRFDPQAQIEVSFGALAAAILSADDEVLIVETPASSAGLVDVAVEFDGALLSAPEAFTFFDELLIGDSSPSQGDAAGGTQVTVTGSGFSDVIAVTLGGISVSFDIIDDETITFTTPEASGGSADLVLRASGERTAILEDAFFFITPLELWSHTPTRGSTAGNTYVEIRGTGFTESTEIFFGDFPATDLELLDPYTLAIRTPRQSAATVSVTAVNGSDDPVAGPDLYTYFNPGAPMGGAWGNPINGAVNVIVFSYGGAPIEDAFVMLSTNPNTPYTGITNEMGMVTLSGPDVLGEQTITAVAAEHSSTTVQRVDAENITIFLHSEDDGEGVFPPPPPMAVFTGEIQGLDKINRPNPDEVLMALVYSTRPSLRAQIPDPGGQNVVLGDGTYTINTRVGDLALVAIGGLYNNRDQTFTPDRMGVARHLTAADGETYQLDIELDLPLNETIQLKYDQAPLADPGPNTNRADLYLDLGIDGIFGPMERYETDQILTSLERIAPLTGDIADASYTVIATTLDGANPFGIPFAETVLRNITNLSSINSTAPITSTIDFTSPANEGSAPENGLVQWSFHGAHRPDVFFFLLIDPFTNSSVWEILVPGTENSFIFPQFPDLSQYDLGELPVPYPGGTYILLALGLNIPGVSANNYTYDQLFGRDGYQAFSVHEYVITLPNL